MGENMPNTSIKIPYRNQVLRPRILFLQFHSLRQMIFLQPHDRLPQKLRRLQTSLHVGPRTLGWNSCSVWVYPSAITVLWDTDNWSTTTAICFCLRQWRDTCMTALWRRPVKKLATTRSCFCTLCHRTGTLCHPLYPSSIEPKFGRRDFVTWERPR